MFTFFVIMLRGPTWNNFQIKYLIQVIKQVFYRPTIEYYWCSSNPVKSRTLSLMPAYRISGNFITKYSRYPLLKQCAEIKQHTKLHINTASAQT